MPRPTEARLTNVARGSRRPSAAEVPDVPQAAPQPTVLPQPGETWIHTASGQRNVVEHLGDARLIAWEKANHTGIPARRVRWLRAVTYRIGGTGRYLTVLLEEWLATCRKE